MPMRHAANVMVWHYTIRERLPSILAMRMLRPATAHVPEHERPVVWFSANQSFEPTARKAITHTVNGKMEIRTLTVDETEKMGGGLLRFGVDTSKALPWREIRRAAGIRSADMRRLEAVGIRQGASPTQWYGIVGPVPLDNVEVIEERIARVWQPLAMP